LGVSAANTRALAPSTSSLATMQAMARMAYQTSGVVHVVVARAPGIVESARGVAARAAVAVTVDLMARTVRVRFDGQASPH
jgi:hypothetical protein